MRATLEYRWDHRRKCYVFIETRTVSALTMAELQNEIEAQLNPTLGEPIDRGGHIVELRKVDIVVGEGDIP